MFDYLLSYHYYRKADLDALADAAGVPDLTFFADSGAFSAHTTGAKITVEEYGEWLTRWRHRFHAYASLDVLFDHVGTMRNTRAMQALGFDPIPVFHLGSPMSAFEQYLDETNYVAIGGMASGTLTMRDPRMWKYLDLLHKKAQERRVRLHGFGLSAWPVMARFPWYSIDSSTPSAGHRWGWICLFDPFGKKWRTWRLRNKPAWRRWGWLVREYGMRPEDFDGDNRAIRPALIKIAAASWSRAAESLPARVYLTDTAFEARTVVGEDEQFIGTYQNGNGFKTRTYLAEIHLTREMAWWQEGNREGATT